MKNEEVTYHPKQSFDELKTNRLRKEQTHSDTNKSVAENEKNEKSTGKPTRRLAEQNAGAHSLTFIERKTMKMEADLVLVREAVTAKAEAEKAKRWNDLYFHQYHRWIRPTKPKGSEESANKRNMKQTKKEDGRDEGVCCFMNER